MEGLVKDLVDWGLGDDDGVKKNDEDGIDERSRSSSWAQIVSGDQENEQNHGRNSNRRNEERVDGRNQEWGSGGSQPSRRPQKAVNEEYERYEDGRQDNYKQSHPDQETGEESNDGWETVGKKPARRHQQVNKGNWDNFKRPANEQEYSNEVSYDSQIEPSQNELSDLGQACNKLWDLDHNRLTPGKDYEIDCGEGKKSYQNQDMAEGCLFTYLNDEVFKKPTISRFCSLLDNYNPHEGYKEEVTSQEKQEQAAFIEEICRTAPIKYLHKYLCLKGIVSEDPQEFKRMLTSLWFDLYGRGGTSSCSSAFEHVFVGEIKSRGDQSVSGFHNWLQFYMEEAKGNVDYQGYIYPRRRGQTPDSETQLLTIQFEWNGVLKSVSSTLVGVSPEFEIALYTLCFYMGNEDNYVELGPYNVNIKCYRLGNKLGSAFPIADS
ncbi:poly(U)-specific endoribonuclease-B-like [Cynara cardunculus var. scolymus]|uniref:poly(U)-specific endoribonuclease-B-like n=1 Tax=Cynara cardunculus var. scolymus TaxID=59895 RepID=UPI000D62A550|nr:poly(U)-specific endoribonuclease-B-like [Cynara cardunculus var. scolymus]